jgi:hypothetical protein
MGNSITAKGCPGFLQLSNGATSVLLSVLLLAGSDLARTRWEIDVVRFFAEKDQAIFGSGMVDFDLDELGWSAADFEAQKRFLLAVVDRALARHRWDALAYDPSYVAADLAQLRSMVERFAIGPSDQCLQLELARAADPATRCAKHRVYMHVTGCLLCHDEPTG